MGDGDDDEDDLEQERRWLEEFAAMRSEFNGFRDRLRAMADKIDAAPKLLIRVSV